ncbi:hypothetical protein ABENE_17580 [Asticcacaulis benevestitus DSM 16100 = ATCC BAA-896]|uniref:Uncharacterized protein n=1 Tax=Asticcacaulis benevestitus DSM 16100 = ATCC BAA-896 TaxID=1121022 RepID=V4PNH2_9CAUL|nr:hypothetical protein ABENE_17580 [Asticcacaulis benevestitus DSM 16100 = ATCC BAA-896]
MLRDLGSGERFTDCGLKDMAVDQLRQERGDQRQGKLYDDGKSDWRPMDG